MNKFRLYLAASLVLLAVVAIIDKKSSVTEGQNDIASYGQNGVPDQDSNRLWTIDKTARNKGIALHVEEKQWVKEWKLAFNDPALAYSLLLDQLKMSDIDAIFRDLDDETILNYLSQQSNFCDDITNWPLYLLLQRRAFDKDPKLVVDYMRRLGAKDCDVIIIDEAMASFVMLDDQEYIEYLISECSTSYFQSAGYPYLKKLKEYGYTYTQGIEAIYKYDPAAAKMLVETFFNSWSDVPRVRVDEHMWISKQEKIELISFVQTKFPEYNSSSVVNAIERMKEKQ